MRIVHTFQSVDVWENRTWDFEKEDTPISQSIAKLASFMVGLSLHFNQSSISCLGWETNMRGLTEEKSSTQVRKVGLLEHKYGNCSFHLRNCSFTPEKYINTYSDS